MTILIPVWEPIFKYMERLMFAAIQVYVAFNEVRARKGFVERNLILSIGKKSFCFMIGALTIKHAITRYYISKFNLALKLTKFVKDESSLKALDEYKSKSNTTKIQSLIIIVIAFFAISMYSVDEIVNFKK